MRGRRIGVKERAFLIHDVDDVSGGFGQRTVTLFAFP